MAIARSGLLALIVLLTACSTNMKQTPAIAAVPARPDSRDAAPPVAAKKPHQVPSPNGSREDEYYWLRDDKRENPEMLAYVKAENEYTDACWRTPRRSRARVYDEIIGRLKQDDATVPYLMNGYWYYRRYETGKEYPDLRASQGLAGRARGNPARRQRDGEGSRLLRRRRDRHQSRTASSWPGPRTPSAAASTSCA